MSANLGKIVGHQYDDLPVSLKRETFSSSNGHPKCYKKLSWNKRDLLLYAVGIGATKDDLDFVYGISILGSFGINR